MTTSKKPALAAQAKAGDEARAELARLRALLTRTIDHVSYGSRRSYDGVGGYKMREAASQLLLEIMAALAAIVAPPAQPAEQQAQTVCKRTLIELDARLRECSIVGASAADAYDTFYQHMVETALAAQPAEPVQRLSDERAAFEAWHNEYRTQELVRRDDTYYNTHVRCRWEGWQARAIESALQPGWRDIETPPGWKLVPICLTPEMREVLLMADRFTVGEVYIMLLAAAPKATK